MLTSLAINADRPKDNNKFVTYTDGLVLEIDHKRSEKEIVYRRNIYQASSLKESLLYNLINVTDDVVSNFHSLKWGENKPS